MVAGGDTMKQIIHIRVDFDEGSRSGVEDFYSVGNETPTEKLFSFLTAEGIYDDIQVVKHFSTSKEVMNRLKGK
jgi:hypothetical protein